MTDLTLADSYRLARLQPSPDTLKAREEALAPLLKTLTIAKGLDLVRLLSGQPTHEPLEWVREAFYANDTSFSLIDNAQEVQALAAVLLERKMATLVWPSLVILVASVRGRRRFEIRPDLVALAQVSFAQWGVKLRPNQTDISKLKVPAKSKLATDLTEHAATPDITRAAALLKGVTEEADEHIRTFATEAIGVVDSLSKEVKCLREESAMLWWVFGGWSRILEKPFATLPPCAAAIMAGIDLADLSETIVGPIAAPAMLHRILFGGKSETEDKHSLKDAIGTLTDADLKGVGLHTQHADRFDICPLMAALAKAKELGRDGAWAGLIKEQTLFDLDETFSVADVALQAFLERQLMRALA